MTVEGNTYGLPMPAFSHFLVIYYGDSIVPDTDCC